MGRNFSSLEVAGIVDIHRFCPRPETETQTAGGLKEGGIALHSSGDDWVM